MFWLKAVGTFHSEALQHQSDGGLNIAHKIKNSGASRQVNEESVF